MSLLGGSLRLPSMLHFPWYVQPLDKRQHLPTRLLALALAETC